MPYPKSSGGARSNRSGLPPYATETSAKPIGCKACGTILGVGGREDVMLFCDEDCISMWERQMMNPKEVTLPQEDLEG